MVTSRSLPQRWLHTIVGVMCGRNNTCRTERGGVFKDKIDYRSQPTAERCAGELNAKWGRPFDAYQCGFCRGWHVGNARNLTVKKFLGILWVFIIQRKRTGPKPRPWETQIMDQFMVTAVGCGLAGLDIGEMAKLFIEAPGNCWFDTMWQPMLGDSKQYWGTWTKGRGYEYSDAYKAFVAAHPEQRFIFVFGSNEAGVHGAGAALDAKISHGAIYGHGVGRKGNSYAVPTKNTKIETLDMKTIRRYVAQFLTYARNRQTEVASVTA